MGQYLNHYSTERVLGSSVGTALTFGFDADTVRLTNLGGYSVYFGLGSSAVASTASALVRAGNDLTLPLPSPVSGVGLYVGTTSTNATDTLMRVEAWGG